MAFRGISSITAFSQQFSGSQANSNNNNKSNFSAGPSSFSSSGNSAGGSLLDGGNFMLPRKHHATAHKPTIGIPSTSSLEPPQQPSPRKSEATTSSYYQQPTAPTSSNSSTSGATGFTPRPPTSGNPHATAAAAVQNGLTSTGGPGSYQSTMHIVNRIMSASASRGGGNVTTAIASTATTGSSNPRSNAFGLDLATLLANLEGQNNTGSSGATEEAQTARRVADKPKRLPVQTSAGLSATSGSSSNTGSGLNLAATGVSVPHIALSARITSASRVKPPPPVFPKPPVSHQSKEDDVSPPASLGVADAHDKQPSSAAFSTMSSANVSLAAQAPQAPLVLPHQTTATQPQPQQPSVPMTHFHHHHAPSSAGPQHHSQQPPTTSYGGFQTRYGAENLYEKPPATAAVNPNPGVPADGSQGKMTPSQALDLYDTYLTRYERREMMDYDEVYFVGMAATKIDAPIADAPNFGYDDDRGDYKMTKGDHIAFRYEVLSELGKGSFGQVLRVHDFKKGSQCALKIIRNKKRFHQQATVEIRILDHLRSRDPEDRSCTIRMLNYFKFRCHTIITFEIHSINLYELTKLNKYQPFAPALIKRFTAQILVAMSFMWREQIVHCFPEEDHQLLTSDGWKSLHELESLPLDTLPRFYSYDPATKQLVLERANKLVVNAAVAGGQPMVEMTHDASDVSIVTTPNHDMLVKKGHFLPSGSVRWDRNGAQGEKDYAKHKASSLLGQKTIRSSGEKRDRAVQFLGVASGGVQQQQQAADLPAPLSKLSPTKLLQFLELFGGWLCDGSLAFQADGARDAVCFNGVAAESAEFFEGLDHHVQRDLHRVELKDAAYVKLFFDEFESKYDALTLDSSTAPRKLTSAKWVPNWAWQLSQAQLRALIHGAKRDSADDGNALFTSCAVFRDELERMCLLAGYSVSFSQCGAAGWQVRYSEQQADCAAPVLRGDRDIKQIANYKGRTWCVSLPHGFVVVRRACVVENDSVVTTASRPMIAGNCDLKPENILLKYENKTSIKLIDFGSSCFETERIYTYIQSRFYRAPEIILGLSYGRPIDLWSLGCIICEMQMGYPIFPGESEKEQLLCIMEVLGVPPSRLVDRSPRKKDFFDANGNPKLFPNSRNKVRKPGTKDIMRTLHTEDASFVDFVLCFLQWDPAERITPNEAMRHPWIAECFQQDTIERSAPQQQPPQTTQPTMPTPRPRLNSARPQVMMPSKAGLPMIDASGVATVGGGSSSNPNAVGAPGLSTYPLQQSGLVGTATAKATIGPAVNSWRLANSRKIGSAQTSRPVPPNMTMTGSSATIAQGLE